MNLIKKIFKILGVLLKISIQKFLQKFRNKFRRQLKITQYKLSIRKYFKGFKLTSG